MILHYTRCDISKHKKSIAKCFIIIDFIATILLVGFAFACSDAEVSSSTADKFIDYTIYDILIDEIGEDPVSFISVQDMTSGESIIIDDKSRIYYILEQLNKIKLLENLGSTGYAFGGFRLIISTRDNGSNNSFDIQLDLSETSFGICAFKNNYYQISGYDIGEDLSIYFAD